MKQDSKTETYIFMGVLIRPVIWLALLVAPYINGGLWNVIVHTDDIFDKPFSITIASSSLSCVLVGLLLYRLGIAML